MLNQEEGDGGFALGFQEVATTDEGAVEIGSNFTLQSGAEQDLSELKNFAYYDKDLIVVQNRLLHAISRLNLNERRLILFLSIIVRLERLQDPNKREFFIKAVDFAKEYDLGTKSIYRTFASIAKSIQFKPFFYWSFDDNSYNEWGSAWFTDCGYLKDKGGIQVRLSDTVLEMLTVFNRLSPFTKYQKEWIVKLGSYGIILLELAVWKLNESKSKKCKATFTLEYLREKFDCVDSYSRFDDFRSRVVDKAIRDIHNHTPILISYEKQGKGKKITEMIFIFEIFNIKKTDIDDMSLADGVDYSLQNSLFCNFKMTAKQLSFFSRKINGINGQDVQEIAFELSNVYLQGKYVDLLKNLDFIPSDWYTKEEIKNHPTPTKIVESKAYLEYQSLKNKDRERGLKEQRQIQLREDMDKFFQHAQLFVEANLSRVSKTGIEKMYLDNGDYVGIIKMWEHYLLDEKTRKGFALVDYILSK